MVVGTQVAHVIAYRIAYPEATVRWRELVLTGHDYTSYAPHALGVIAAMQIVGLGAVVADACRRSRPQPVPAWAFALLPPLGFALQEVTERWVAGASDAWLVVQEPTFRIGLALQLPFALLAFLLARLLLRVARSVGAALAPQRFVLRPPPLVHRARELVEARRSSVPASGRTTRGPPLPAC
jgi:hypothetical protein